MNVHQPIRATWSDDDSTVINTGEVARLLGVRASTAQRLLSKQAKALGAWKTGSRRSGQWRVTLGNLRKLQQSKS